METLPRCSHGNPLMDWSGELLEPDCGCRFKIECAANSTEEKRKVDGQLEPPLLLDLRIGCPCCTERDKETYALRKEVQRLKARNETMDSECKRECERLETIIAEGNTECVRLKNIIAEGNIKPRVTGQAQQP